jgi:uncharacterized protein (TIGR00304 family)
LVAVDLAGIGLVLVIVGFVIAFIAIILVAVKGREGPNRNRGAGILLIGPIPIIFGTDRESVRILLVLAIVLIIVFLALMLIPLFVMK